MEKPRAKEEMTKERVLKSDGRYLIFYRFKPAEAPNGRRPNYGSPEPREPERRT